MTELLDRPAIPPTPAPTGSQGPRYRAVWLVPGILLTLVGLLIAFQVARGLLGGGWTTSTRSDQQVYTEQISQIDIYTDNGDIDLVAARGSEVVVERRTRLAGGTPSYVEEVSGGSLRLDAGCPVSNWFVIGTTCQVDYLVQVPDGVSVWARTDAGDVRARGVDGDLDLISDAGDIEAIGISGDLVAYSDAGNIQGSDLTSASVDVESDAGDLELGFVEAPGMVVARTDAGDIDVTVPQDRLDYAVESLTDAGSIDVDISQDPLATRSISVVTDAGDIRIGYRNGASGN